METLLLLTIHIAALKSLGLCYTLSIVCTHHMLALDKGCEEDACSDGSINEYHNNSEGKTSTKNGYILLLNYSNQNYYTKNTVQTRTMTKQSSQKVLHEGIGLFGCHHFLLQFVGIEKRGV